MDFGGTPPRRFFTGVSTDGMRCGRKSVRPERCQWNQRLLVNVRDAFLENRVCCPKSHWFRHWYFQARWVFVFLRKHASYRFDSALGNIASRMRRQVYPLTLDGDWDAQTYSQKLLQWCKIPMIVFLLKASLVVKLHKCQIFHGEGPAYIYFTWFRHSWAVRITIVHHFCRWNRRCQSMFQQECWSHHGSSPA